MFAKLVNWINSHRFINPDINPRYYESLGYTFIAWVDEPHHHIALLSKDQALLKGAKESNIVTRFVGRLDLSGCADALKHYGTYGFAYNMKKPLVLARKKSRFSKSQTTETVLKALQHAFNAELMSR